jgi:hypothetical protein
MGFDESCRYLGWFWEGTGGKLEGEELVFVLLGSYGYGTNSIV